MRLFTAGSALCATAQTDTMLIAFRLLQGLGGGFVLPIAMAYVYRLSPPDRVGAVMGMLGVPILLAPAIGPVVGGWLVQYATWHWIFLLNVPVGAIGIVIGLRSLPVVDRHRVAGLDLPGSILGPLAFAAARDRGYRRDHRARAYLTVARPIGAAAGSSCTRSLPVSAAKRFP